MAAFGAVYQAASVQTSSASSLTTTGITTTSGRLLVALVTAFTNTIGATPITDSKGNTWTAAVAAAGTTNGFGAMFYCENCVGGAGHTFTLTLTGADAAAIAVLEILGIQTSGSLHGVNHSTASATTHSSGTVTSDTDYELMVGMGAVSHGGEGTPVAANNFQLVLSLPDGSPEGIVVAVKLLANGVTDQFQFTAAGGAANEFCGVASFRCAAASGGGGAAAYAFA